MTELNAKQCPYCSAISYSAYTGMQWLCPSCGQDITEVVYIPANVVAGK